MAEAERSSLSDEEFEAMYDRARLALHAGRVDEAADLARQLVEARPRSTTAHELMGDVYAEQEKLEEAEREYRIASELEPANADAQRKLGEVVLRLKQAEIEAHLVEMDLAELAARGFSNPEPEAAALRSALFPGLGQLYNGEYEKGCLLAAIGLIAAGFAVDGIFGLMAPEQAGPLAPVYAVAGSAVYVGLYAYSIWDAVRGAREHQELRQLYRNVARRGE